MKTPLHKNLLSIIAFIFLYHLNLFSGIVSGTLVSTPNGLTPVESLQVSDTIVGYDLNNGITHTKITMITKKENLDMKVLFQKNLKAINGGKKENCN